MSDKLRVAVLFGGRSGEHEVSLMSARSVLKYLDKERYHLIEVGITHQGEWLAGEGALDAFERGELDRLTPVTLLPDPTRKGLYRLSAEGESAVLTRYAAVDVFFPVLHGTFGEDGTIQGLFEMAGVAYVGAGVLGSSLGMDKAAFKDVMRANGVPVVESLLFTRREIEQEMDDVLAQVAATFEFPVFVKPANMGSSVGVNKCRSRADLMEGLLEAVQYDRRVLVERGVEAREIEISVLGNERPRASVPGEVLPAAEFYTYEAKYHDERSQTVVPADLPFETSEAMRAAAVRAYRAIDCAGMARVDFLLDRRSGEFYLNEVNTIPGFTQISMYPKLWEASGLPYPQLLDELIALALERREERDRTRWRYERDGE
ncbi:MAG: D-alanine--D-alanine ligase [Anaerolineae bacterium]|nr:MAG: D-alanine--D-alanine ligase [Anaerolineae bacterium]